MSKFPRVLVRLLMLLAFIWMAWLVLANWPAIVGMVATAHWGLLALAVALLVLANIGMAVVFAGFVRRASGQMLPASQLAGTFLVSQVAKYIPGKIWSVAIQATMLRAPQTTRSVLAANLELALVNLLLVTGAGMAFMTWIRFGTIAALMVLLITWAFVGWVSRLQVVRIIGCTLKRAFPCLDRLLGSLDEAVDEPDGASSGRQAGLLLFLAMYCLGWWLLARGATTLDARACMGVVAAFSLSYIVGVVSLLPAGVGAREGVLVLLAPALGLTHADMAAIAIASRTAMLVMDALAAATGAILLWIGSWGRA